MSSVFVPPDIQTVTNAAAAALASENICAQIAAGLSSSPYAYMLDGVSPAAIMSAPKGLFTLNGAQVPLSSLLSFSSGQKYTVGPDGNYMLNAANGPAWDWSTGRRRLLIEAIGSTNSFLNSENASLWGGGGYLSNCTAASAANGLLGTLALTTLTSTAANAQVTGGSLTVDADGVVTYTLALVKTGTISEAQFGIYGSTSLFIGPTSATVLSGPGAVSGTTLMTVTGLTATPTIVRVTRTGMTPGEAAYPELYVAFTGAAQTLGMGRPQFEKGYGSSYIVAGASPTPRAADVVTAASGLLALLTAANAALSFRGTILGNPSTAWGSICGNSASLSASSSGVVAYDGGSIHSLPRTPGAAVDGGMTLGACASYTSGKRKVALNGSAVATDNYSLFTNADSPLYFAYGPTGALNLLIDEIVVWPIFASDAGLQAQARVYS